MSAVSSIAAPRGRPTKRAAVVAAATRLFLRDGFSDTSMEAIAGEAGVIKQTVYRYFPSKEDLFGEIMDDVCRRTFDVEFAEALAETENIRAALTGFARPFVCLHTDPDAISLYRLVVAEGRRFPRLARAFLRHGPEAFTGLLAGYLAERQRAGRFATADCHAAAGLLLSLLLAPFQLELVLGTRSGLSDAEIESIVNGAVDRFLQVYPPWNG